MSGPAPKDASATKRRTVLVVEDDPTTRTMIARALAASYHVHEAVDGQAAIDLLGTIAPPDLFILDVMMPRVDGITLAKTLKADPKMNRVPIIFLTAKASPGDVIQGIKVGAKHYISKPFSITTLLAKIEKLLG